MGESTSISWTDATFNPHWGCTKIAPGCASCYAASDAKRYGKEWGPNVPRYKTGYKNWRTPLAWNRAAAKAGVRKRVFCASMADVFEDFAGPVLDFKGKCRLWRDPNESFRDDDGIAIYSTIERSNFVPVTLDDLRRDLFALIDQTPWLDWQLLTKRPQNIRRMWTTACTKCGRDTDTNTQKYCGDGTDKDNEHRWAKVNRPNCWLGCSVSDQPTADQLIPELAKCRDLAPVLFVSAEPLLGPIDLEHIQHDGTVEIDALRGTHGVYRPHRGEGPPLCNWVIVGGESGARHRPVEIPWIASLVHQCRAAGVPVFVKQASGPKPGMQGSIPDEVWNTKEFPSARH